MKKYCSLLLIASAITCVTSCQETATEKTGNNTMNDTTASTTPAFDLNKARSWIESDNAKFSEEAKRGDSNALAAHYTSDAWLMFDNSEPLKGAAIASGWSGALRSGMKELKITTVDLIGNAELLVETGMYEVFGNANKTLDKGKYVVVWKPENGGWKIYRDIGNSNMAPHK
jgi:ketosteroid isomerase-like protein